MDAAQDYIANIAILNEKIRQQSWYNTIWAKFSGNVDVSFENNGNRVMTPSGSPIEILNSFVEQGRDNMLIPFELGLTGSPVYGDTVVAGTGEDMDHDWLRVFINQYRKAVVPRSGRMAEQRAKMLKVLTRAEPALRKWVTKWENQAVSQAFYEGVSPNLSAGTSDDGLGLARRYHPNWYINDGAVLTSVGGTAGDMTYEKTLKTNAQLDTAIGGTNGTCDTAMTSAILFALRVKCMELMIPQIETEDGFKFWAIYMHPRQLTSLMGDSTYVSVVNSAYTQKVLKHPLMKAAVGYYAGFAIFEDIVAIRSWDEDNSSFFGTTTAARFLPSAVTSNKTYSAIVLGNGAMGKGIANPIEMTTEKTDHENVIEVAANVMDGYNRTDFFGVDDAGEVSGDAFYKNQAAAHDAAALSCINQSSLIFSTKHA